MKKIILISIVLLSINNYAQGWFGKNVYGNQNYINKTKNVGDYDSISVAGDFDVSLYTGKEGEISVKIEENLWQYLVIEVKGDALKIRWKKM